MSVGSAVGSTTKTLHAPVVSPTLAVTVVSPIDNADTLPFSSTVATAGALLAHTTSPFIRTSTIEQAVEAVESGAHDSAFSAERIQTFTWWKGEPLNYSLQHIPRTQDLEPLYVETSAFFVFRSEVWKQQHRRISDKPFIAVTDRIESMDIDNPDDFTLAEAIVAAGLNR